MHSLINVMLWMKVNYGKISLIIKDECILIAQLLKITHSQKMLDDFLSV
jgi:hypothetical protein